MLAHLPDLLQDTLDLLILKSLAAVPLNGWAIATAFPRRWGRTGSVPSWHGPPDA